MPAQTRSGGKSSAATTYKSTPAAPKQQEFSHRRRSVKATYGKSRPRPKLKQETLTQMHFTSSAMRDFADDEEDEKVEGEEVQEVELEQPIPAANTKAKAKSRGNRRKTAGDDLGTEEMPRQSKRRKTLGDSPNPSVSSSFHTQTLTQMLPSKAKDEDPWQIEDSQDDEDSKLLMETPTKALGKHGRSEVQEEIESAVPSLVQSSTPANRQKKTEIPSSQSPWTPMIDRYSPAPHNSPLMAKSTNVGAPSPILKTSSRKTPRNAVIPDSYSTAHDSSPVASQKSTVKATPSKRLRFDIPEDKENITPGRTKPKSPKQKSQTTGRRPLQEVPDSDDEPYEDVDETEYETEDEFEVADPESPTPKRFQNVTPIENTELELELPETVGRPLEKTPGSMVSGESQLPDGGPDLEAGDENTYIPRNEAAASPGSIQEAQGPHSDRINSNSIESPIPNEESAPAADTQVETRTPETPRAKQRAINQDPASIAKETPGPAPSEQDENEGAADDLSPSQEYLYTQGLESQRLPLDSIRALGPQTPHSDIMVSLHPEHIARIVDRTKNHEFRAWKIPQQVNRVWVYITRPHSELKYMCRFGEPKVPGEIEDETGVGNVEFNQGKKAAKFAYEILQVYELNNPVSLEEMKRKGWVAGPPQKYTYIPPAVVGELTANLRCALFEEGGSQSQAALPQGVSESQELKAQLQSDADYSTQHYSEDAADEVIPASQSPRKDGENAESVASGGEIAKRTLTRVRSTMSNQESPKLPANKNQRGFVRPSQATTVSQVSSSPAISPGKSGRHPIPLSSSSPVMPRRAYSSLRSSQLPTTSQMLPASLLNDDIQEPPPIVWDSADEQSD